MLERCGALARSYGAKKQAIAVDNLLSSMVKAGVRMNSRFLNNALVSFFGTGTGGQRDDGRFAEVDEVGMSLSWCMYDFFLWLEFSRLCDSL